MIRPIREGRADMVLGSRMCIPGGATAGGMPVWKRVANRFLTTVENLAMGRKFTECHTGLPRVQPALPGDGALPAQRERLRVRHRGHLPGGALRPAGRRGADLRRATSTTPRRSGFRPGVVYGLGTLWTALRFLLHRWGIVPCEKFRR